MFNLPGIVLFLLLLFFLFFFFFFFLFLLFLFFFLFFFFLFFFFFFFFFFLLFFLFFFFFFFFSGRRRHTIALRDWSSDVCSSDLALRRSPGGRRGGRRRHLLPSAGRPHRAGRRGAALPFRPVLPARTAAAACGPGRVWTA